MRGVVSLVVLLIIPLASGIIVDMDSPYRGDEIIGREVVITSLEFQWSQEMWDELEN
jgi:hypothetical protein